MRKAVAGVLLIGVACYVAYDNGLIDGLNPITLSADADRFDAVVANNDTAEFYGLTFILLADKIEDDREVLTMREHVDDLNAVAGPMAKKAGGGVDNPDLPLVIGTIINEFGSETGELTPSDRRSAAALFRRVGNGLLESSKR